MFLHLRLLDMLMLDRKKNRIRWWRGAESKGGQEVSKHLRYSAERNVNPNTPNTVHQVLQQQQLPKTTSNGNILGIRSSNLIANETCNIAREWFHYWTMGQMTFFRNIAKQRQAIVNLMINIAGDHLKSKAKEQMSPLPLEFRMGDKEFNTVHQVLQQQQLPKTTSNGNILGRLNYDRAGGPKR